MSHLCHARGCAAPVPPTMFMCRRHWFMVPAVLRTAVWRHYRPGQEVTKDPSRKYLEVTRQAVEAVAAREGATRPEREV